MSVFKIKCEACGHINPLERSVLDVAYEQGRKKTAREILVYLHENGAIYCEHCPCEVECKGDCWDTILNHLPKEE